MDLSRYQKQKLENPELVKQKSKEKYQKSIEQQKLYRQTHKEEKYAQRAQTYICECGQTVAKFSKWYHIRGKPHLDKVNQQI